MLHVLSWRVLGPPEQIQAGILLRARRSRRCYREHPHATDHIHRLAFWTRHTAHAGTRIGTEASADARVGETAGRSAWQLHASDWAEIGTLRAGDAFPDALAAAGKALETMLASNARSRSDAFQLPRRWVAKEACEVRTSCDPSR